MTRNEAVETIKLAVGLVEWDYPLDFAAAFEKAVTSLEAWDKILEYAPKELLRSNGNNDRSEGYRQGIQYMLAVIRMVLENEVDG